MAKAKIYIFPFLSWVYFHFYFNALQPIEQGISTFARQARGLWENVVMHS